LPGTPLLRGDAGSEETDLFEVRVICMTLREFYLQRCEAEFPVFMRVLKEIPKDKLRHESDESSPSEGQLVWTLLGELKTCLDIVNFGKAEWKSQSPPSLKGMLERYDRLSEELIEHVRQMDEAAWDRKAKFYYKGKVVLEQPAGEFLWFVLFNAIHHRGQLTAYLRAMGAKVPTIYGASADKKPNDAKP
jgi:uncharacterized damage-inducible protein DinB